MKWLCLLLTVLCPLCAVGHWLWGDTAMTFGFGCATVIGVMTTAVVWTAPDTKEKQ